MVSSRMSLSRSAPMQRDGRRQFADGSRFYDGVFLLLLSSAVCRLFESIGRDRRVERGDDRD